MAVRTIIPGPPGTGKTYRVLEMQTIKLDKPNPRKLEVEKEPWQ